MALYPKLITDALSKVRYPGNGKDLVSAGMVEVISASTEIK